MRENLRICLAASAGGHLTQLLKVAGVCRKHGTFVVTTSDAVRGNLNEYGKVYVVGECNREHPFRVVSVLRQCVGIILRERPDVIVSTGAAPGCLVCFLGKLAGAKVVWLDSITNVERLSLSGRMIRLIADLFLVQWPELAERYRRVEYIGTAI